MDFDQKNWGLRPVTKNIPSELKEYPRWICYRAELRSNNSEKVNKIPINPHNPSRKASTNQHESWGPFDLAIQTYESNQLNGIGFVISDLKGFIFIDLDNCRSQVTKKVDAWAQEIVNALDTYTELSPSGTGLRIICEGELTGKDFNNHGVGIEMYGGQSSRYLTITGHILPGCPKDIKVTPDEALKAIYAQYSTSDSSRCNTHDVDMPTPDENPPSLSELALPSYVNEFLEKCDASCHDNDRSRALMSACQSLYKHNLSDEQVLGVLKMSPGAMETAIDRRGNEKSALEWIWKYTCLKARPDLPITAALPVAPEEAPKPIESPIIQPEGIFNVKGTLKATMDSILVSSTYPQQLFALGGAVSLVSFLMGNRFRTTDGLYANIFTIAIGPTGCGKDAPRKVLKHILQKLGYGFNVADSIASGPGLEDFISTVENNTGILLLDEIGKMLQQLNGRNGDEHGIMAILLKFYTAVDSFYTKRLKAGQNPDMILHPFVTLYGTTTEGAIESTMSEQDTEVGWLGRLHFIKTANARPQYQLPKPLDDVPGEFSEWVKTIKSQQETTTVDYLKQAEKAIRKYQTKIDEHLRSDNINPIARAASVRLVEMVKKFALISSVSREPKKPRISKDDVEWAIKYAELSRSYIETDLTDAIENNGISSIESKQISHCLDFIKRCRSYRDKGHILATEKGFMPKRLLQKKMKIAASTFKSTVNSLLESGEIELVSLTKEVHGINCETAYFIPVDQL